MQFHPIVLRYMDARKKKEWFMLHNLKHWQKKYKTLEQQ